MKLCINELYEYRIMKRKYYVSMALAMLLSGCGNNDVPGSATDNGDRRITLQTSIAQEETVARSPELDSNGSGNFSDGDVFALQISSRAASECVNFDYTVASTQLYWKEVSFSAPTGKVNFAACYPKQDIRDGKFVFDLASASSKDLLLAYTPEIAMESETPVNLTFKHAMHRLVVNFAAAEGVDITGITTKCTAKSSCEVNLFDGTLDNTAARQSAFTASGEHVSFTLVPQRVSDVVLEVSFGGYKETFALERLVTGHEELKGGMQLSVDLTVKNGYIELGNVTIEGWENQGTIEGSIIL